MSKKGPRIVIEGGTIAQSGRAGILCENPEADIEVSGVSFIDNPQDIVAPSGVRRLEVKDSFFAQNQEAESKRRPVKPSKKYFGGFSFSKGDHLK